MNDMKKSKLLATLLLAVTATSWAADNSIYIDQSGDFAGVTIYQDGAGNVVRGLQSAGGNDNTTPALIRGNDVKVDIKQTGSNNKMDLGINAVPGTAKSVDLTYSTVNQSNISGSNNTARFQFGVAGGATVSDTIVSVIQLNGGNNTSVTMQGSDNQATVLQSGGTATFNSTVNASGTRQTVTTSGGTSNSVTTNLTGDNGHVTVTMVGATNTASITQSGAGTVGHQVVIDANGTGNNITVNQSGVAGDNVFHLKLGSAGSAANSNVYNITQKN